MLSNRALQAPIIEQADLLLMRIDQVARVLNVPVRFVQKLISEGQLPVVRIGHRTLVPREALESWVKLNTVRVQGPPVLAPGEDENPEDEEGESSAPVSGSSTV